MLPEPVIDPTSKNLTEEDKKDLEQTILIQGATTTQD